MIKIALFLLFIVYILWKGWRLWKEKEKRELWIVSGFSLMTVYFMLANSFQWPSPNFLLAMEDYTGPISRWLQDVLGAALPK